MCPTPDGVARPPRRGLAGQCGFLRTMFKNGPVEFPLSVNEIKNIRQNEGGDSACLFMHPLGLDLFMTYCLQELLHF